MWKIFTFLLLILMPLKVNAQIAYPPLVRTVNSIQPDAVGNIVVPVPTFISGFTPASPGTWANLLSTAPCDATRASQYAVVSDLYAGSSATNEVTRCGNSGSGYYWRPQRENYAASVTTTGGSITWTCGVNAPILSVSGTLLSTQSIALQTTGCWPGAQLIIANNAVLGLFNLNVTGLLGGVTRSIGLNGRQSFYYDNTNNAWVAF